MIKEKADLRRIAIVSQRAFDEAICERRSAAAILTRHVAELTKISQNGSGTGDRIRSVDELGSVFTDCAPLDYFVEPELPFGAIVYLAGDSESGKSTLACAWARDVIAKGHAVLLLDRDRNPRERIRDRFQRLGMDDHPLLRVWDSQQKMEAPQPDSPIIIEWATRVGKETGLPPLVICDSVVSFFEGDEDENSSTDMRAFFNRCRALTRLGACAVPIHHTGKNGEIRGSSDFKGAGDQGFIVTNWNPDGGRLLCRLTLKVHKSRYGLTDDIAYNYAGGKMIRDLDRHAPIKTVTAQLTALLRDHPGAATTLWRLARFNTSRRICRHDPKNRRSAAPIGAASTSRIPYARVGCPISMLNGRGSCGRGSPVPPHSREIPPRRSRAGQATQQRAAFRCTCAPAAQLTHRRLKRQRTLRSNEPV